MEQFEPQNKAVLDYNPKYKTNIYNPILIQMNDWLNKWMGRRCESPMQYPK